MTIIITRITVTEDGLISVMHPLPVGQHVATVEVATQLPLQPATEPFDLSKLPQFDLGPWPEGMTLSREQIYGDDGR